MRLGIVLAALELVEINTTNSIGDNTKARLVKELASAN
jgi:hypothetical protein